MKKNIILSIVLLVFIFISGILYYSNRRIEGYTSMTPSTLTPIYKIPLSTPFKKTHVLIQEGKTVNDPSNLSQFCAIIQGNRLKIFKKLDGNNNDWDQIWVSNISNKFFSGDNLKLTATELTIGSNTIVTGLEDAYSLELVEGDLLIKNSDSDVLWSLLDQEIKTAKTDVKIYMSSSETVRATLNGRNELKDKLTNLKYYVENIESTLDNSEVNPKNYAKMADIRRRMDFELSEINNASGSKINVSQTTLQSTMYMNLGITILATSLIVLLYSR
jgi:hypothetical protein